MTETDTQTESPEPRKLPARAYLVGALTQFGVGLYSPFLQAYLIDMQVALRGVQNFAEQGAFRSVGNFAPTVLQPAWGATSDRVRNTKAFVAFGTITGFLVVYMFLWASSPLEMIVLYAIQSILFSIQIPTWLSLVGGLMDDRKRGDELGKLGLATNIASLSATLISGFIAVLPALVPFLRNLFGGLGPILFPIQMDEQAFREAYYGPFFFTAIVGIISSLLSTTIKERPKPQDGPRKFPPIHRLLSQPGDFRRFCFIAVFFSFAMSMAWPYFIVVQKSWLNNSNLEIAIASAVMTMSIIIFTVPFGRLSDRVGRKPLILLGRGLLFIVPIMYAFAQNVYYVYTANILAGFCVASGMNAITAYIYDISPEEERGSHLAVYNTFTGVVYLCGSLIAGVLGQLILIAFGSEYLSVFFMLLLSGVLRFFASFFYLLIREPREYSSTLWLEISARLPGRRHDADIV
ncbi:MAG: Inner membrane transport protein YajR [Candidatus Thorarchaeota archaeon AB_25]|nr:MAG: Inner membrane transport protein YajR [Candidatus Thorarchaeota archaeon AB_25]